MGHIARFGKMRNSYKSLVGKCDGIDHLGKLLQVGN